MWISFWAVCESLSVLSFFFFFSLSSCFPFCGGSGVVQRETDGRGEARDTGKGGVREGRGA